MREKSKSCLAGILIMLLLGLTAILITVKLSNHVPTAYAATNYSLVYTTQGKIEVKGVVIADAPTDFYTVTMESKYTTAGTDTLANYSLIDWAYATFKVNVNNHGRTEHTRYTLTRDGETVSAGVLSGRSSITVCSVELTNGVYEFTYVSTYWTNRETHENYPYVFHFIVDNEAPTYEMTAGGLKIPDGGKTANNLTYSTEDEHFARLYYKSPYASDFRTTTDKSYTVEAKESNTGWWQFFSIDSLGQRNVTVKAYLDCKPPQIKLENGMSFGTTVGKTIKATASDEISSAKLYVKFEDEEWVTSGNSYTISDTERNGRYYFYAVDGFGNKTDTSWIVLSTEEPVGRIVKSDSDNSVSFVWENEYWSATLDGRAYNNGVWISEEGNHIIVLSNNAEKDKAYAFSIEHNYIVTEEKSPTCTENGWNKYECTQCGDTQVVTAYSPGHKYSVQNTPATCVKQGCNKYTCTVCGYSYIEQLGLPSGHSYTSRIIKEANCTDDGMRENICDLCGEKTETRIAAHGHSYEITEIQTKDGNTARTYTCRECGDSYTQELGNQYEEVTSYVEYLFEQYSPYMIWVFLATAGVWSIAIGVAIILAHKNEDKEKVKKMLVNYLIGLVVIFAILVACPYLIRGIAILVTS